MYEKNLIETVRLRLSSTDMDFLRSLSAERGVSISECIRSLIGEYRRSIDMVATLRSAVTLIEQGKVSAVHGDTESDIHNIV